MKYHIKVKRDFGRYGYYDSKTRRNIRTGYVVTDGHCNIIPGACWFKTIEDAFIGIEAHRITGDAVAFYEVYRRLKAKVETDALYRELTA